MLSSTYMSVKSVKVNIFHANISRGRCVFPKVGEWVTQHVFAAMPTQSSKIGQEADDATAMLRERYFASAFSVTTE